MAFRPYAHHFVEWPFDKFAKGQDREFTGRLRTHSEARAVLTHDTDSETAYRKWLEELSRMKKRVKQQRVQIAQRDEIHTDLVLTEQKLRQLRSIMRKRHSSQVANQYRLHANAKILKPQSHAVSVHLSASSSRPQNSHVFLPLADDSSEFTRELSPTPRFPDLGTLTRCGL